MARALETLSGLMMLAACSAAGGPSAPAAAAPASAPATVPAAPARPRAISDENAETVKSRWKVAAGGWGKAVAASSAADLAAVASEGPVRLYRLRDGSSRGALPTCSTPVRGALALRGAQLVLVCESEVQRFDAVGKKRLEPLEVHESRATAAVISGDRVAIGHHDGVVRIYSLDGKPTIDIPVPGPPIDVKSLALSADGSVVAVAWVQGSVWWWRTATPDAPQRLVRHPRESDSVAFNADGTLFAEEGKPGTTTVWKWGSDPSALEEVRNGAWVKRIVFTHDSKWLIRGGSDGLALAEIGGPRRVVLDSDGEVEDVALDEHGRVIVAVDRKGRFSAWSPR